MTKFVLPMDDPEKDKKLSELLAKEKVEWKKLGGELKDAFASLKDVLAGIHGLPENVKEYKEDILEAGRFMELAKKHIVKNSNEIHLLKREDNAKLLINFCYGKDGEMIEEDKNCFVTLEVSALSTDVAALFAENDFIILK